MLEIDSILGDARRPQFDSHSRLFGGGERSTPTPKPYHKSNIPIGSDAVDSNGRTTNGNANGNGNHNGNGVSHNGLNEQNHNENNTTNGQTNGLNGTRSGIEVIKCWKFIAHYLDFYVFFLSLRFNLSFVCTCVNVN